jgi:hypothetical protein
MKLRIAVRFYCLRLAVLMMATPLTLGQTNNSAQTRNAARALWLVRSQSVTEELIKDASDLPPSARALLWARLGELWWQEERGKARSWLLKAVAIVEDVPNREGSDERSRRLNTARALLQIITPLDQGISKKLIPILDERGEEQASDEREANADALIRAAIALVEKNPERAAEMGTLALRIGRPSDIASLIFALRGTNTRLSEALFGQALIAARQTLTPELLHSLTRAAFPAESQIKTKMQELPDPLRRELLRLHIAYLEANQITQENRNSICLGIVSFILPVVGQIDRLLPEQGAFARQSVNQCQSLSPLAQQVVDDSLRQEPLRTIDDLLKAADDAQDVKVRSVYQYRAAALAKNKKDYQRAIQILDSMSKEGREFMQGSWEAYRWEWAARLAIKHFQNGDLFEMRKVIEGVPTNLQPLAKLAFISYLPEKRNKETDPTLEYLNDGRIGLGRSSLTDSDKAASYLGLLELTVKYQPGDAIAVLNETVAVLNKADKARRDHDLETRALLLEPISRNLSSTLLEMDEYAVKKAISTISATDTRVRVRLDLLQTCLTRLFSETAKPVSVSSN